MRVQRDVALRQLVELMRDLGYEVMAWNGEGAIPFELDHDPALGIRPVVNGEWDPHQHDPRCLVWRPKAHHAVKTNGEKRGESEHSRRPGDKQKIAKAKRLGKAHEEFRARLLAKPEREPGEAKPKRKIPSRPFGSGRKRVT